jgi:hypothetical protein
MLKKRTVFMLFLLFAGMFQLFSAEFIVGKIKLLINEKNGRFLLYSLEGNDHGKWMPLIWDRDQRSSFFSVVLNGHVYKLGDSSFFKMYLRGTQDKPMLAFECPYVNVTVEFSFIRTANADTVNGIRMEVRMQNWYTEPINAGLRLLLDTSLGERSGPHFRTNLRLVDTDTRLTRADSDQHWTTSYKNTSLMGSIFVPGTYPPDMVHFANWKRLSDTRWELAYAPGRRFNLLPYSIKDSGVCYYMQAATMVRHEQRVMTIMLATEDTAGFLQPLVPLVVVEEQPVLITPPPVIMQQQPPPQIAPPPVMVQPQQQQAPQIIQIAPPAPAAPAAPEKPRYILPPGPLRLDIATLREMVRRLDEYIYYGTGITEEEFRALEETMRRLRLRYGGVTGALP